jgi:hypothetical protein
MKKLEHLVHAYGLLILGSTIIQSPDIFIVGIGDLFILAGAIHAILAIRSINNPSLSD